MGARVVTLGGQGLYQNYLSAVLIGIDTPSDIANFQVSVTIPWCPGMFADFSNLQFAQADDTPVLAYRFSYTNMSQAIFWLRIPSANTQEVYCYFDGGLVDSLLSTGAQVFNQFNQFASGDSTLSNAVDNNGNERHAWFDKAQNDLTGAYDLTGTPTWASGAYTLDSAERMQRDLASTDTEGKWEKVISFETPWTGNQYSYLILGSNTTLYIKRDDDPAGNEIWLSLTVNGSTLIAYTDTGVTLADSTYARAAVTYDGTKWQMYWAGVAVGAATAGDAPANPRIGIMAFSTQIKCIELDFLPNVAHTDPFTSDTETRYMQLSSTDLTTWAASAAGDVVVDTVNHKVTLSSADDKGVVIVGRSYNYASGEIEFALDNNNDGGGGADTVGGVFCYQDILNYYKIVIEDDAAGAELLKFYKVVAGSATQLGTTKDVSATYTRGNKTWVKVHYSRETGQMWAYLRDNAGVYPTAPDIADAFSAQFAYGKQGYIATVTTVGAGNLNVDFFPMTINAALLIGETNIPQTESGFYFRDEYGSNSVGRLTTTGTWSVAAGILSCTAAGNATMPFQTTIGVHSFLPTLANGTDYYYFSGYRIKFVASGGNSCVVTLETSAGGTQGTGSLTVTTTAGAFANPIVITETSSAITVTVSGATGSISSGTTTSSALAPKFTIGTATCSFDNYYFSGTLYKLKPTFRGAQRGEYWNGTASVNATRNIEDCNFNDAGEWTGYAATPTFDTANGYLTVTGTAWIPSAITLNNFQATEGVYDFEIMPYPTGGGAVSKSMRIYIEGNGNVGGAGIRVILYPLITAAGMWYYSGGWVQIGDFATTTFSVDTWYKIRITHIGTTYSLFITNMSIALISGTAASSGGTSKKITFESYNAAAGGNYVRVRNININALESTSTNGVTWCNGSVAHGNVWGTGITAGFLMREYEATEPTLTPRGPYPNPFMPRRVPTDGNRTIEAEGGIGMVGSVMFDQSIHANPGIGMAGSVIFNQQLKATGGLGMAIAPPHLEVGTWITAQAFKRVTIHRGLQDKYAQASFFFEGQPDWWFYDKFIFYEMPGPGPADYVVFIGEAPSSSDTLEPAGDEFVLEAFDPGWNLTMQKVPQDMLIMPATTNPGEYIRDLLGGMFDWNGVSGIYPLRVNDVAGWGGAVTTREFRFTSETTIADAIQEICDRLNHMFIVKWKLISGSWIPIGYFTAFADIDDLTDIGFDIPTEVAFTYPDAYVGQPIQRQRDGTTKYNYIRIRCQGIDGTWYESIRQTAEVAAGEKRRLQFPKVIELDLFTQADLDDRADAYWALYVDMATTYSVPLYDRPDIQYLQKVNFTGFGLPLEFEGVSMRVIGITHDHGFDGDEPLNQTTIEFIPEAKFGLMNQISHLRPDQMNNIEAIVKGIIAKMPPIEVGEVVTAVGGEVTIIKEDGNTETARDPT